VKDRNRRRERGRLLPLGRLRARLATPPLSPAPARKPAPTAQPQVPKVIFTVHACERFVERFRPGLSVAEARRQLALLVREAVIAADPPPGLNRGEEALPAAAWLTVPDTGITCPLVTGSGGGVLVATTLYAMGGLSAQHRARRNEFNAKARAGRRAGKLAVRGRRPSREPAADEW